MPNATTKTGAIIPVTGCFITVPGFGDIFLQSLPEITDSKSAAYNDEVIIGRSMPVKTFSHSENRSINMTIHLYVVSENDIEDNISILRALESVVYPRTDVGSTPYAPPPICTIKCGRILAEGSLCVILKQYSVKFPTDVAWDETTLVPYQFDIELAWEVVYDNSTSGRSGLPGQERILTSGS